MIITNGARPPLPDGRGEKDRPQGARARGRREVAEIKIGGRRGCTVTAIAIEDLNLNTWKRRKRKKKRKKKRRKRKKKRAR